MKVPFSSLFVGQIKIYMRQNFDKLQRISHFRGLDDFLFRCVQISQPYIFLHCSIEKYWFLADDAHNAPKPMQVHDFDVLAIDHHLLQNIQILDQADIVVQ